MSSSMVPLVSVIIAFAMVNVIFLCLCWRRKRKYNGYEYEKVRKTEKIEEIELKSRHKQRKEQENIEIAEATKEVSRKFGDKEKEEEYFIGEKHLPEIGSRLQKHWFRGFYRDGSEVLVTEAPLSKKCLLKLDKNTLGTINHILLKIQTCRYIHPIQEVLYDEHSNKVFTVQPLITRGSLKDYIYNNTQPLLDWEDKYTQNARGLPAEKIALFGRQILEAIKFLIKQGFPPLGHVQTGNVFIYDEDCCKLGGYENALLGYRARLYRLCKERGCGKSIDIVMFGHVLYEMACARQLEELIPQRDDYDYIQDSALEDILEFTFAQRFQERIKPILKQEFFNSVHVEMPTHGQVDMSKEEKRLLSEVSKGLVKPPSSVSETSFISDGEAPKSKKEIAEGRVTDHLRSLRPGYDMEALPDIGRRLWKYWYEIWPTTEKKTKITIISMCSVPDSCPIHLSQTTVHTINQFLSSIQHPYLFNKLELHYLKDSHHVMVCQPLVQKGSLRDHIHGTKDPLINWSNKLRSKDKESAINRNKIPLYGRQILEGMAYLYEQEFPPLGHIHTGNIFVEDKGKEMCRLGGYLNTLLGYWTCQKVFADREFSYSIDLIMFGHVMYEMASGRELERVFPQDSDYKLIQGNEIVDVIKSIFNISHNISQEGLSYQHALQQVIGHKFFQSVELREIDSEMQVSASKEMKDLLVEVGKSKHKKHGKVSAVKKLLKETFSPSDAKPSDAGSL